MKKPNNLLAALALGTAMAATGCGSDDNSPASGGSSGSGGSPVAASGEGSLMSIASQSDAASTIGTGVPLVVSADGDLVSKAGAEQDSWFLISHLDSDRGVLDLLVHNVRLQPPVGDPVVESIAAVLDPKTRTYLDAEMVYPPSACTFSTSAFDVSTPAGSMSGSSASMHITADFPAFAIDLSARQDGPLLADLGTGLLPFYGNINYEYSLSNMATSGTVTINGEAYSVSGTSWFDRQWGLLNARFWASKKWTWFGVSLDDGDRISLWDIIDSGREHAFATLMHPNGDHEVVDVSPLAARASKQWTSESSGHTYPTSWDISIPALDAQLHIESRIREQEVRSPIKTDKYEGASTVTGTLRSQQVTGHAVAEMVGDWI